MKDWWEELPVARWADCQKGLFCISKQKKKHVFLFQKAEVKKDLPNELTNQPDELNQKTRHLKYYWWCCRTGPCFQRQDRKRNQKEKWRLWPKTENTKTKRKEKDTLVAYKYSRPELFANAEAPTFARLLLPSKALLYIFRVSRGSCVFTRIDSLPVFWKTYKNTHTHTHKTRSAFKDEKEVLLNVAILFLPIFLKFICCRLSFSKKYQ